MKASPYNYIRPNKEQIPVTEHKYVAELALGKPLPKGAEIHHVDGNTYNNENSNLVICPNSAYHKLLHRRERILEACGNANWVQCIHCKQYGDKTEMRGFTRMSRTSPTYYHSKCNAKAAANRRSK